MNHNKSYFEIPKDLIDRIKKEFESKNNKKFSLDSFLNDLSELYDKKSLPSKTTLYRGFNQGKKIKKEVLDLLSNYVRFRDFKDFTNYKEGYYLSNIVGTWISYRLSLGKSMLSLAVWKIEMEDDKTGVLNITRKTDFYIFKGKERRLDEGATTFVLKDTKGNGLSLKYDLNLPKEKTYIEALLTVASSYYNNGLQVKKEILIRQKKGFDDIVNDIAFRIPIKKALIIENLRPISRILNKDSNQVLLANSKNYFSLQKLENDLYEDEKIFIKAFISTPTGALGEEKDYNKFKEKIINVKNKLAELKELRITESKIFCHLLNIDSLKQHQLYEEASSFDNIYDYIREAKYFFIIIPSGINSLSGSIVELGIRLGFGLPAFCFIEKSSYFELPKTIRGAYQSNLGLLKIAELNLEQIPDYLEVNINNIKNFFEGII